MSEVFVALPEAVPPHQGRAFPLAAGLAGLRMLSENDRRAVEGEMSPPRLVMPHAALPASESGSYGAFWLLDGVCLGQQLFGDGRRQVVSLYLPGDVINPACLVDRVPRHDVVAVAQARTVHVEAGQLRRLAARRPAIGHMLFKEAARRSAMLEMWVGALGRRSAIERMALLFCEVHVRSRLAGMASDESCPLPMTQLDLADTLGLSVVHVNRVVRSLRSKELANFEAGRITVLDWDRLAAIAEFDTGYLV